MHIRIIVYVFNGFVYFLKGEIYEYIQINKN